MLLTYRKEGVEKTLILTSTEGSSTINSISVDEQGNIRASFYMFNNNTGKFDGETEYRVLQRWEYLAYYAM